MFTSQVYILYILKSFGKLCKFSSIGFILDKTISKQVKTKMDSEQSGKLPKVAQLRCGWQRQDLNPDHVLFIL